MSSASFLTIGAPLCPPTVTREVSTLQPEERGLEGTERVRGDSEEKNVREHYSSKASICHHSVKGQWG